jgi:hypothetical protein
MTKIDWDTKNVDELKAMIENLSESEYSYLRMDSLPTAPFPDDIDTTGLWAMDKSGRILWGDCRDDLDTITLEKLRVMRERNTE